MSTYARSENTSCSGVPSPPRPLPRRVLTSAIALCIATFCLAHPPAQAADDDLAAKLQSIIAMHDGEVAVAVKHLPSGKEFRHQADKPMPTASLIKLPIMVAAYEAIDRGELQLDQMVTLEEEDKVPGSGFLTSRFSAGTKFPLRDAIHLMIVDSDNTATNLVIDAIGLETTTDRMEELGLEHTKLHSKVFRRDTSIAPERSQKFGLGSTSAGEMVLLLEKLAQGELASSERTSQMMEHLYACTDRSKIARFLPDEVKFAHKGGSVSKSRTDAGLIESPAGTIAIAVLTTDNADRSWGEDNEAHQLAGRIGEAVYRHFNPDAPGEPTGPAVMKIGASGVVVEGLQRTLNAKLKPSPNLGVDGDFGPATQAAVTAFQKAEGLEPTGEVDADTWKALGPLLSEREVPEPAEVNQAPVDKQPADSLAGRPFVTAKAWVVGDGQTGETLWGHNETESRDMASTTKVMTAYTVLQQVSDSREALEETLTFSTKADETIGSTTNVRAGETLTVREALFGLMLPSGNDASVALAEHFGAKLLEAEGTADADAAAAYERFVQQMNADAEELGMTNSHFENTHGLTAAEHHASAADLMKLAAASLKNPLFREIVSTPRFGCTVTGEGGYQRNVVWRNTNRLLGIEGYDGVKTGTTNAAGACLVAHGNRDGRQLFVVVLGSSCSDARYTDARNLFRWAWKEQAAGGR